MKGDPGVIDALNDVLKWERTLAGCYAGYHEYFERWHFRRLSCWFKDRAALACARVDALEDRLNELGAIPGRDAFEFEVQPLGEAKDIVEVYRYFAGINGDGGTLPDAASAYEDARDACDAPRDSVTKKLLGRHKAQVEDDLAAVEAKLMRIGLIGPELYLALHMHLGD